jgi:hypothetical protein
MFTGNIYLFVVLSFTSMVSPGTLPVIISMGVRNDGFTNIKERILRTT